MLTIEMGGLSRWNIHAEDTIGIGSYPEIVALNAQGMDIEARKRRTVGIVEEGIAMTALVTGKTAVVGSYPDVPIGIFTETAHNITLQAQSALMTLERDETFGNGRDVIDTPIERAEPQSSLSVVKYGIDEAIINGACMVGIADQIP